MFEKRLLSSKILYAHKIFSREIYQVTPGNEPKAVAVAEDVSVDLSEWLPFGSEISQTDQGNYKSGTPIAEIAGADGFRSVAFVLKKMFDFIGRGITRFGYSKPLLTAINGFGKDAGSNKRHQEIDLGNGTGEITRLTEIKMDFNVNRGTLVGEKENNGSNPNPMLYPNWEGQNKGKVDFNAALESVDTVQWATIEANGVAEAICGKEWSLGTLNLGTGKYKVTYSYTVNRNFTGMEILEWNKLKFTFKKWSGDDVPLNDDDPKAMITQKTSQPIKDTDQTYVQFVQDTMGSDNAVFTIVARLPVKWDKMDASGNLQRVNYVKDTSLLDQESLDYDTDTEDTYKLNVESDDGKVHQSTEKIIVLGYTNPGYPTTESFIYVPVDLGMHGTTRKKKTVFEVYTWFSNKWTLTAAYSAAAPNGWETQSETIGGFLYEKLIFKTKIQGDGMYLRLHLIMAI